MIIGIPRPGARQVAADGRSLTTRAYPTPTSRWRVDGTARVHRLELPAG